MRAKNRNLAAALALVGVFAAALLRPPAIFGGLLVYGKGFAFTVAEPANWKSDIQSAARWGANIIFYPQEESPSAPGTIVIRIGVFDKTEEDKSKALDADIHQYQRQPGNNALYSLEDSPLARLPTTSPDTTPERSSYYIHVVGRVRAIAK